MIAGEKKVEKKRLARADSLLGDLSMPSRPDVLLEVMRAQSGFAPDPLVVTGLIRTDMALSSALLQAANTRLKGWKRQVISIDGAATLLGFDRVRAIVSEQFLSATLVSRDGPVQTLRLRAVDAARRAERLAQQLPEVSPYCRNGYLPAVAPDEAYAIGLLHDCGLIAMLRGFPDYANFCRQTDESGELDLVDAENARFGTNHCLAGYLMMRYWQMPETLCHMVRVHHRLDDFNRPGVRVRERYALVLRAILYLSAAVCSGEAMRTWNVVDGRIAAFFGLEIPVLEQLRSGMDAGGSVKA